MSVLITNCDSHDTATELNVWCGWCKLSITELSLIHCCWPSRAQI